MFSLFIQGVAVNGPGFASTAELASIYHSKGLEALETKIPAAEDLSSTQRRRVTATIKLALSTASAATKASALETANIASIFATSKGDSEMMHYLGKTLATKERLISPTKFHNSLHNSASGYWTIAAKTHEQTQAVSAGANTFIAGLMQAAMYCQIEQKPVLYVVYDLQSPEGLRPHFSIEDSYAAAFLLAPKQNEASMAKLNIAVENLQAETKIEQTNLECLRKNNPAAKSLPLLYNLQTNSSESIYINYLRNHSAKIHMEAIA